MPIEKRYAELYERYRQTGDKESLRELMRALHPIILKGINTFGSGFQPLYGKAKLLALNALESYDPRKGSLESHIMLHLQRLQRYAPDTGNVIRISETTRMLQKQIAEAEKEFEDRYQRPPSDQELADYLGLNINKIRKARMPAGAAAESAFEENVEAQPLIQDSKDNPKVRLWQEAVYKELSPIQQYIAERRLGLFGYKPEPIEKVAKKLRVSPATVSNYAKEVAQKLTPPADL